jgi:hypothetical protein
MPSAHTEGFQESAGAATFTETNDGGDGITVSGTSHDGTILYDADIEPDADHDGYADITQDGCPTDTSTQGPCLPAGEGGGSTGGDAGSSTERGGNDGKEEENGSAPRATVTSFKASPASFQLDKGTKLKLRLSAAARVTFTVQAKLTCHRSVRHCKPLKDVANFSKQLQAGPNKVSFPGANRKLKQLPAGSYRIAAAPTKPTGTGKAIAVTVLP